MKKSVLPLLFLSFALAAAPAVQESIIHTMDDKDMKVLTAVALPDGSIEYTLPGSGKQKVKIPRGRYLYAWIPKPKEVSEADVLFEANLPEKAIGAYRAAYAKYSLLGWDVYCIYRESEALSMLGQKTEALAKLDQLKDYKTSNPRLLPHIALAKRLNAKLCIELGKFDQALQILKEMTSGTDDSAAAFGFMKKGDILKAQNKNKEASLMYLQTVLLFRHAPERPEALAKLYTVLQEMKDPNAAKFGEMLKREYPDSDFTKKLFGKK